MMYSKSGSFEEGKHRNSDCESTFALLNACMCVVVHMKQKQWNWARRADNLYLPSGLRGSSQDPYYFSLGRTSDDVRILFDGKQISFWHFDKLSGINYAYHVHLIKACASFPCDFISFYINLQDMSHVC